MSYQVLARKWRPQLFSDVVGQEHVLTALANGLSMGRLHHAYLFSGTRGVGKTSIARLLAKGLNCQTGVTATPCGKCENCLEIEQGRFVDLIEIDAASRTKVEDTRELLDNVQYLPVRGRFKVYLIDEVHMLSRHSFNALLKTLEEPPPHVKFLLATTDPQKLPVTILSRCLQFHLKALDVEQIAAQLEKILGVENIQHDVRAIRLISRAAEGSMRDALSLTDQAIALGGGSVLSESVANMLGTLDEEQPLSLLEALVQADGSSMMNIVEEAAARGVDWEALLVDMQSLLHRIAMGQLLSSVFADDLSSHEQRLRNLAKQISPQDIQLYYQILLIGRKELSFAPDRRMGVEMTLLRALAFHPLQVSSYTEEPLQKQRISGEPELAGRPESPRLQTVSETAPARIPVVNPSHMSQLVEKSNQQNNVPMAGNEPPQAISDAMAQLMQARTQLKQRQETPEPKKSEPVVHGNVRPAAGKSLIERFASVSESQTVKAPKVAPEQIKDKKPEAYRWKAQLQPEQKETEAKTTPRALRSALEHEKTPELTVKLAEESILRDAWAAEIDKLSLPKLVQQLALNAFKEQQEEGRICLHLRSSQRHLNSAQAQKTLTDALSEYYQRPVELTVVEDDNPTIKTPLEWRQAIYEEKLAQARQSLASDTNIQTLCRFFDAELDEDSIRPV